MTPHHEGHTTGASLASERNSQREFRWASFDCYGTLIDWTSGLAGVFSALWPGANLEELLARYHEIEPRVQLGTAKSYRHVLAETLRLLAESEGLPLSRDEENALAEALPGWSPFREVPGALDELRRLGWKLAILSNTDQDLLEASLSRIGVPIDLRITAAEAGSYKPAHGHWRRLLEHPAVDRRRHVHVAASIFHDIAPAQELGLTAVWINRLRESSDLPRAAELPDLSLLPDTLEEILPS